MAFKVQVGPVQIAVHQGQTVLVTGPEGQVNWPSARGLYFRDTRVIWLQHTTGRSSLQLYRSDQCCIRLRKIVSRDLHRQTDSRTR
jgi:hypothetical protein